MSVVNLGKVCIFTSAHSAYSTRIFRKQAKSLVKAGYDVTLIAQNDKDEAVDGVKIVALPKPRNRLRRMLGVWRVFNLAFKQKADVYHFHDPELLPAGLLLKFLTKGKVIYDVHEDYPKAISSKSWLPPATRKPLSSVFNLIAKPASLLLDYIIAATDDIAKEFKKGKVTTVRNYPVLGDIKPKDEYDTDSPSLIYIGSLSEEYGIKEVIQSLRFISGKFNARLQLIGTFSDRAFEHSVRSLIKEFKNVELIGWQPQGKVFEMLKRASIGFVICPPFPNSINAEPNKMFEYMATGLPVIVSDFPLWKEIVEGNGCGVTVNPLSPEEIAGAVEHLLSNPGLVKEMGGNGRKATLEKYNWENEGKKLLAIYSKLL